MFKKFKCFLKRSGHRREYPRRTQDICVCDINGQTYPLENWSFGGLCIQADERLFAYDQTLYITLKFKMGLQILEVRHKAKVIRKSRQRLGLKFHPLTPLPTAQLRRVIDESDTLQPV